MSSIKCLNFEFCSVNLYIKNKVMDRVKIIRFSNFVIMLICLVRIVTLGCNIVYSQPTFVLKLWPLNNILGSYKQKKKLKKIGI